MAKRQSKKQKEQEQDNNQGAKQKPVWEYILGGIKGAVWKQQGQFGRYYTYTTSRLFEGEDDTVKSTKSFKKADAGNHKQIIDLCFRKMIQLEAQNKKGD
jgi:hypothetical protein